MRPVDIAFFTAEHDDNHISAIETIAAASRLTPAPATRSAWHDLPYDVPLDLLERHRIIGSDAMVSHITLHKGCNVPVHSHANEQFSCVLSGKVRYTLANDETCILAAGDVLHLPGFAPHGAEALETTVLLDIFSPPSESTGIDKPQ
jgi:quercetin dioxygenase-like cupin family protein